MKTLVPAWQCFILTIFVVLLNACSPSEEEVGVKTDTSGPATASGTGSTPKADEIRAQQPELARYTYLIVHGASGGGWDWKTMDDLLTSNGHKVYRPTLTGLGQKTHLNNPAVDLSTHINDITNVILFEDLHEVVLVGHSYGGMVITGVMNRIASRIKHVVFLDAAVPDDGMSSDDVYGGWSSSHTVVDGIVYFSWLDESQAYPRDVPQSLKTLTEPVTYNNPVALKLPVTYIAYVNPGQSLKDRAADPSWHRAEQRHWTIRTLESDHNAQRSHPMELTAMLEAAPEDQNRP